MLCVQGARCAVYYNLSIPSPLRLKKATKLLIVETFQTSARKPASGVEQKDTSPVTVGQNFPGTRPTLRLLPTSRTATPTATTTTNMALTKGGLHRKRLLAVAMSPATPARATTWKTK